MAYKDTTSSLHTYLMLDLRPDTEKKFRVRSNILEDPKRIYNALKEKKNHLQGNYGTVSMSKNIKKNLPMLTALHCFSKAQKKEMLKRLKPDAIKVIYECIINIINKNIKVSDQEKRKTNRNRDKTRELVNPRT